MGAQCHHHPDNEAVGACCYCDRPMCGECLLTNREGKAFCKREEECLAFQDALEFPDQTASPILDGLLDESTLDAQMRRLSETLEEVEELKGVLEDDSGDGRPDASDTASPVDADPRILGCCAWRLAEEAAGLTTLLSLRVDFIRREQELSGSTFLLERANEVQGFLEQEAEPKVREYRDWAEQYSALEVSQLLESMGATGPEGKA